MTYARTFLELQTNAVKWWPADLTEQVAAASPIPLLVQTQEKFISILKLSGEFPEQVFNVLKASGMAANLFVKHLAVMADYGGEPLKKLGREFRNLFPTNSKGEYFFEFAFLETPNRYTFKELPVTRLDNPSLYLDGKALAHAKEITPLYEDVIMLLLHAATSDASNQAGLSRCDVGSYLGKPELMDRYIRERYIHVSRITAGADTNALGQIAQTYVCKILKQSLPDDFDVKRNGTIKLEGYGNSKGVPFDVVVSHATQKVGIEVSFQVTTNSTIERKASLAEERLAAMHASGHLIAYVLDGAGNFERESALKKLCEFSDCTVAYSEKEILHLADFIREKLQ